MRVKHTARKSSGPITPRKGSTSTPSTSAAAQTTPIRKRKGGTSDSRATPGTAGRSGKKRHRFRAGTVALREIRKLQKSVELLIPAAPFIRTGYLVHFFSRSSNMCSSDSMLMGSEFHLGERNYL
uniref:Uncharacterized protein n=1 Tax=Opuntia streptacantha TaxID=393608 RepID=A0A7C8ZUI1_OPUST